jgi:hypothetical protein
MPPWSEMLVSIRPRRRGSTSATTHLSRAREETQAPPMLPVVHRSQYALARQVLD